MAGTVVAVLGLGAAYSGYCGRPIGWVAFRALNGLGVVLVYSSPWVSVVAVPAVLASCGLRAVHPES